VRLNDILPESPGEFSAALPNYAALFPSICSSLYTNNRMAF
jgi:hypothetical protein